MVSYKQKQPNILLKWKTFEIKSATISLSMVMFYFLSV